MSQFYNFNFSTTSFLIGLLVAIFLIIYLVDSLQLMFIYKALDLNPLFAFIPFYARYRIYKEYKNRVFEKNWGVLYLITLILTLANIIFLLTISISSLENLSSFQFGGSIFMLFVTNIVLVILNVLFYWPLLSKNYYKIIFLFYNFGFGFIYIIGTELLNIDHNGVGLLFITLAYQIFLFVVFYKLNRDVKAGVRKIVPRLDENIFTYKEIDFILKIRGKNLTKNADYNFSMEAKFFNKEII